MDQDTKFIEHLKYSNIIININEYHLDHIFH